MKYREALSISNPAHFSQNLVPVTARIGIMVSWNVIAGIDKIQISVKSCLRLGSNNAIAGIGKTLFMAFYIKVAFKSDAEPIWTLAYK